MLLYVWLNKVHTTVIIEQICCEDGKLLHKESLISHIRIGQVIGQPLLAAIESVLYMVETTTYKVLFFTKHKVKKR